MKRVATLVVLASLAAVQPALSAEPRVIATIKVERPVGRMIGESRVENGAHYFVVAGDGMTCAGGFDPAAEGTIASYRFACSDGTTGHAEVEWRADGKVATGGFVIDGKGEIGTVTVEVLDSAPVPEDADPPPVPKNRKT
ncbi:hypothetical protein [Chthonobacter rhizosphaerae]|uniref:hypothetical protein n=1 Tax=Chthonobacter rhizosphaerae TaxID=2735553 RepID=UPI0015EF76C8|nr:hypothetical protein [Chthonobacter rhizosphaerae]